MKYFLDTEFIESLRNVNGKSLHVVELISIGIVCEDGRELYAISNEFDHTEANEFVRENVLSLEFNKHYVDRGNYDLNCMQLKTNHGMPISAIKRKIINFMQPEQDKNLQVYGYFADYDWVVFASIFGTMMDLPKGMPFFCMDLKQMMQERGLNSEWKRENCPDPVGEHHALVDAMWNKDLYERITNYRLK